MRTYQSTAGVLLAVLAVFPFLSYGEVTAQSYVQDGLVGLWDAEENAGWGTHEVSPTVWKDLTGITGDMYLGVAGTFRANAFEKTSAGVMASNEMVRADGNIKTIEVVISGVPANKWAVPVFLTNRQMVAVRDMTDYRQITCAYWGGSGLQTQNRPVVATISAHYYLQSGVLRSRDNTQGGSNAGGPGSGQGFEPKANSWLCVGCESGAEKTSGDYATTGYKVHSIRFYNRELTDEERQDNLIVDHLRFDAGICTTLMGDAVWTGGAGDGKFSTAGNWRSGLPIFPGVGYERIILAPDGEVTIENDIGVVTAQCLRVSQVSDATAAVTLRGNPLVLTSASSPYATSSDAAYALVTECPLSVDVDMTFSGDRAVSRAKKNIVYNHPVVILSEKTFSISAVDKATHTFNDSVTASDATFETLGGQHDYFNGPVTARLLKPGVSSSLEYFHFAATRNDWSATPLYYGGIYADATGVLPAGLVFRWDATSYPTTAGRSTTDFYALSADQTCDRIVADRMTNTVGRIMNRGRIRSETGRPTLTLKGTADALSYGALESKSGTALSVTWDPIGTYTQTFADQRHTMCGDLIVKGGTLASVGTNSFPSVSALRIFDEATFAVRTSMDNAAANPFPGATELHVSGSGAVEVSAGVTVTFAPGFRSGVLLAAKTYQAEDGTDATAEKVPWVKGSGLVQIEACNGTSWKGAMSGDWNDSSNWSNGRPENDATPVYLTCEGGSPYTVVMKEGDVWPRNLVIRGANAKLQVGAGQSVAYDGTSKSASIAIEEGGTLEVAGTLMLTNYVGTFTIGSTTAATSRFAVMTGGYGCYAPKYNANYPIALNANGALDACGGTLALAASITPITFNGGYVLASGAGTFAYGGLPTKTMSMEWNGPSKAVFAGNSALTRVNTASQAVNFGNGDAGTAFSLVFRDNATWATDGDCMFIGGTDNDTLVAFDSDVVHPNMLGYRVRVAASGTGTAEMRVSAGRVRPSARGLDIADDNKAETVRRGKLVQTGGWIYNEASDSLTGGWVDQNKPNGFTVGYGAAAPVSSGTVAYGEAFLSGGTNENVGGVTLIGTGFGEGSVVQNGGTNLHDSDTWLFGIGAAGGMGRWTVSNGLLRVAADAYIGGFSTNNILPQGSASKPVIWPVERHDAEGALVAAGGEVDFKKNLVLGADGRGTIDIVGSTGTFKVGGDLVFSNQVANATSGGTLNFVLDAQGVKPIQVVGRTVFRSNAKITIDVSACTDQRSLWLIKTAEMVNPIRPEDIELIGVTDVWRGASVRVLPTGCRLVGAPNGTTVILR